MAGTAVPKMNLVLRTWTFKTSWPSTKTSSSRGCVSLWALVEILFPMCNHRGGKYPWVAGLGHCTKWTSWHFSHRCKIHDRFRTLTSGQNNQKSPSDNKARSHNITQAKATDSRQGGRRHNEQQVNRTWHPKTRRSFKGRYWREIGSAFFLLLYFGNITKVWQVVTKTTASNSMTAKQHGTFYAIQNPWQGEVKSIFCLSLHLIIRHRHVVLINTVQ